MWDAQLPLFERYYRVIRYDTRGHGLSETPKAPYTWDDLVGDAFSVLDAHKVAKATVLGLSLGGMTALGMGLAQPKRISRIVCCACRADAPAGFVHNWDERVAMLDKAGIGAVWDGTVPKWLTESFRAERPEAEARLKAGFLQTTPEGYRGCAAALKTLDYLRDLGGMLIPTLCVAGSADLAAPPAVMQAVAAACANASYAEVPDTGHIINVNQVQSFNLAIAGFLEMVTS